MGFRFFEETRFKETEIGIIPEDWEVVRLGEVVGFKLGKTPPRKTPEFWNEKYFPWVSISDMEDFGKIYNTKEYISKKAFNEIFKGNFVKKGTLLMSFKLTIGRTAVLEIDAFHNEAIVSLYPNNNRVDRDYLFFLLPTIKFANYYDKAIKGNTLNKSKIANLFIPLPSLSEQKAIAEVLQAIQEAKEKTEAVIKATRELKKSMMKQLFSYGVNRVNELRVDRVRELGVNGVSRVNRVDRVGGVDGVGELKETEIGVIPKHWQVVRLGEVLIKTQYGLSKRGMANAFYPILRMNNLSDGKVNCTDLQFVNLTEEEVKKFALHKGDILFNRTNSFELVGKVGLFDLEGTYVFASYLIRLKCDDNKLLSSYLTYYLCWDLTQSRLKKLASRGVSQSNISASKLLEFKIPLPPLSEQKAIAEILQSIDDKIQKEESKKQAIEKLFKTMLSNLMSGKLRVNRVESE